MDDKQTHCLCQCSTQRKPTHQQLRAAAQRHQQARLQGEREVAEATEILEAVRRRAEQRNAEAFAEVRRLAAML